MTKISTRFAYAVLSFELVDDPIVVAAAAPGEQPWKAVLIEEGVTTTDHRSIVPNGLSWRELPLTLGYQGTTPSGFNPHGDAIASGRIETLERTPGAKEGTFRILATGAFTADPEGQRAAEAVRSQKVRGVSADVEAIEVRYDAEIDGTTGEVLSEIEVLVDGRIMGAIITPHPAFADATIEVDGDPIPEEDPAAAEPIAASARPGIDSSFFEDLSLDALTPFTVEAIPGVEGTYEVFGHIAPRNVCHLGLPGCRTAPLSKTYALFHRGTFEATDRKVAVGVITLGGFHTDHALLREVMEDDERRSFEDMEAVACYVRAGHDSYGVWVHGVTRAGMTAEEVELLSASSPSGEWVGIPGGSELFKVHNVPAPAFPVPRVLTASAYYRNGEMISYRSAGVPREPICDDDRISTAEAEARIMGAIEEVAPALVASALGNDVIVVEPMVASAVRTEKVLLSIVERLDRIEKTQSAMVRFGSFDFPESL